MPIKDPKKKAEYNLKYQNTRYARDKAFRKKKIDNELRYRKEHKQEYNEYMQKYRRRIKQHALFLEYITTWKAMRNKLVYFETLKTMQLSEEYRKFKGIIGQDLNTDVAEDKNDL
jgi:hypothetical protein